MKILNVFIALTLANFVVQFLGQKDYATAMDRSYFQGVALFTYWLIITYVDPNS